MNLSEARPGTTWSGALARHGRNGPRLFLGTSAVALLLALLPAVSAYAGTPPGPPQDIGAAAGGIQATVTWGPPASSGSSPIDHYVITAWNGNGTRATEVPDITVGSSGRQGTVTGLQNNRSYFFNIFVFNATDYNYGTSGTIVTYAPFLGARTFGPFNFSSGLTGWPYSYPNTPIGQLFFKQNPNDVYYSWCTAAAVTSPRELLIVTAGHCVNSGGNSGTPGQWYSNFYFYPAYNGNASPDQRAPYGFFTGNTLVTTGSWANFSNLHDDFAVIKLNPNAGGTLQSRTGSLGIVFQDNQSVARSVVASGYPINYANAQQMAFCSASYAQLENFLNSAVDDGSQIGIGCDMEGGSSGGPWRTSDNLLRTVSSYESPGYGQNNLFGPYLGRQAQAAWHLGVTF